MMEYTVMPDGSVVRIKTIKERKEAKESRDEYIEDNVKPITDWYRYDRR